jgi:hypothetical protein
MIAGLDTYLSALGSTGNSTLLLPKTVVGPVDYPRKLSAICEPSQQLLTTEECLDFSSRDKRRSIEWEYLVSTPEIV